MKTTVFIERAKFYSLQKNPYFLLKCIDVYYVIIFLGKKGKFFRTLSTIACPICFIIFVLSLLHTARQYKQCTVEKLAYS